MLSVAVIHFFNLLFIVLLVYCLLTWIPGINWSNDFLRFLRNFCEFFFAPFRALIPPIGGFDLSPIFAFLVLPIFARAIVFVLRTLHL